MAVTPSASTVEAGGLISGSQWLSQAAVVEIWRVTWDRVSPVSQLKLDGAQVTLARNGVNKTKLPAISSSLDLIFPLAYLVSSP